MSEERVPFNDLSRSVTQMRPELSRAIGDVLDSGWYVLGPNHAAFERELAEYLNVHFALGCANGTDALGLALRALGVSREDTVLIAANAGGYSATAINLIGATTAFADVDPDTHLLSVESLSNAVSKLKELPKVVVVTHLYGAAAPMYEICDWASSLGIKVIEDCAQALGAKVNKAFVGTFGDVATTSFYPTKNLGALGDGGAVLTNNVSLAEKIRSLRQYGWSSKYDARTPFGTNSRLDEIQAAILRLRLPKLDSLNSRRREIHARFEAASPAHLKFVNTSSASFVGHLAVIEVAHRNAVVEYFSNKGVATDIHYPIPDHLQSIATSGPKWKLPVTERLAQTVLSLPLFPELAEKEITAIEDAIRNLPDFSKDS